MGRFDPDNQSLYDTPAQGGDSAPVKAGRFLPSNEPITSAEAPPGTARTWKDTLQNVGQTADDALRAASNALTFGGRDRLEGYLNSLVSGKTYNEATNEQVKLSEEARKRSPYASVAGDVGGALVIPGAGGARLAARMGSGWGARALGFGAEGAGIGALQGAGNTYTGKPLDYITNAGVGGVMGGVLGAGTGAAFGPRPGPVSAAEIPAAAVTREAGGLGYDALRQSQARYNPAYLAHQTGQLERDLVQRGYHRENAPETYRALDWMRGDHPLPGGTGTPGGVDAVHQMLNNIKDATDGGASRLVKDALHNFLTNPPRGAVIPGTEAAARQAGQLTDFARGNWAGAARGQTMADMRVAAENQAQSSYSGLNVENNIRNQVKNFINPKTGGRERLAGYTPEEREALQGIVSGGTLTNIGRWAGNIAGGGGGIAVPIAAATGAEFIKDNPAVSVGVPAAGLALRMLSNRTARNRIAAVEDMINMRNPLYQARAAAAGPAPLPASTDKGGSQMIRDAITTGLIKQGFGMSKDDDPLRITVRP